MAAAALVKQMYPHIDADLFSYIESVLDGGADEFATADDIYDAIGAIMTQAVAGDTACHTDNSSGSSEAVIRQLCDRLFQSMTLDGASGDDDGGGGGGCSGQVKLLDAPIHMASAAAAAAAAAAAGGGGGNGGVAGSGGVWHEQQLDDAAASVWLRQREPVARVDVRKLAKAEERLRRKQSEREAAAAATATPASGAAGVVTAAQQQEEASASQVVSRRDARAESRGAGNQSRDVRVDNFDLAFGDRRLLESAQLMLAHGRRYGLVGRNGLGKSTLLRALAARQLSVPPHIRVLHVAQEVVGDSTEALQSVLECDTVREQLLQQQRQLEQQLSQQQLPPSDTESDTAAGAAAAGSGTVADDKQQLTNGSSGGDGSSDRKGDGAAAAGGAAAAAATAAAATQLADVYAQLAAIEADRAPARAAVILRGLGFSPAQQRLPTSHFSGGWRMRLALARALFAQPDLLLLDEPTNMLDMGAILWLEQYLMRWPTTLLVVSHDRNFLELVPTDIVHLHSRRLDTYRGGYAHFVKQRDERRKHQQREYEAQQALRAHAQEFIDKFRYNAKRASLAQSKIKMLERLPVLEPVVAEAPVVLRLPKVQPLAPPVLRLDEVSFSYPPPPASGGGAGGGGAARRVFTGIDLSADMQSRICIVGDNGAGKTTLLKILIGQLEPTGGLRHVNPGLRVGYFAQHHVDQLAMNLSCLQLLEQRRPGLTAEQYRQQLGSFQLGGQLATQLVGTLSGGQKSRLALAAICLAQPNFLVLDEPTNHLDLETIEALAAALVEFAGGVVLVSHDERLIRQVCRQLWLCADGRVTQLDGGFDQYRQLVHQQLEDSGGSGGGRAH